MSLGHRQRQQEQNGTLSTSARPMERRWRDSVVVQETMANTEAQGPATPASSEPPSVWVLVVALHTNPDLVSAKASFAPGLKIALGRHFERFSVARALDHPQISEQHLSLDVRSDTVLVSDLSKNGTFVNGVRMSSGEPASLCDGDVLTLGPVVLLLRYTRWLDPEPNDPILLGKSAAIADVLRKIHAAKDVPVLIGGET